VTVPTVVIVPTRDRPAMLREALASIAAQTEREDVAIVVADDGDVPSAERAALAGGGGVPAFRLVRSEARTPGGARNAAVRAAERAGLLPPGALVALLDDDDLWLPHHLARARAALADSPLSPFAHARATTTGPRGEEPYHAKDAGPFAGDLFVPLLARDFVATSTIVARADALRAEGFFREDLTHGEDWDVVLKLSRRGPVAFVDEPTAIHREHAGGASTALEAKARAQLAVIEHWWRHRHRLAPHEARAVRRELSRRRRRLSRRARRAELDS
jgi:glycosyltransferase involved in cell wall biosynthesis